MRRSDFRIVLGICLTVIFFLFGCAVQQPSVSPPDQPEFPAGLAVWDMAYSGAPGAPGADWGELLSSAVIETFQEDARFDVVEREKLMRVLEELSIGASDLADDATRLRLGEIVGARYMVFGSYIVFGGFLRLDMRLVRVETGEIVKAAQQTVQGVELFRAMSAAKAAALSLR